jgi:hypothetical protein
MTKPVLEPRPLSGCIVAFLIILTLAATFVPIGAAQTTSNWTDSSGNWSNPLNWDNGVPNGNYNANIEAGSSAYTVNLDINATVANLDLCASSTLRCATLNILQGTTLTVQPGGIINDSGTISLSGGSIVGDVNMNSGSLTGSGTVTGNVTMSNLFGGGIQVNQGDSLSITGNVANQETVVSTVVGSGGSLTIGGTLENGATVNVDGGVMTVGGNVFNRYIDTDFSPRFEISNGGIVNVNGSFTNQYETSLASVSISGGSVLNVAGDFNNLGSDVYQTPVTIAGGSSVNVKGNFNNVGSGEIGSGSLFLTSVTIDGSSLNVQGNLNNVASSGPTGPSGTLMSLTNGSTFTVQQNLNNSGTLSLATGSAGTVNGALNNSGSVQIDSTSVLTVKSGFNQTAGNTLVDGILRAQGPGLNITGGTLSGTGIVNGNVTMSGTMSPGDTTGTFTINGNYTQTSTGTLVEQVGWLNGCNASLFTVNGVANLNGTLALSLLSGYDPTAGDSFILMTFLSDYGSFNTVTGLNLGNNLFFDLIYDPHDIRVEVESHSLATPEPNSFLLVLGCIPILVIFRKWLAAMMANMSAMAR